MKSQDENTTEAFGGDVSRAVADGVLCFDREEQCTEEIVHLFDTHFRANFGMLPSEIRLIVEQRLLFFGQDEVAVFDGNEKIEKGEEKPTQEETEQNQCQDKRPFGLHDKENNICMHILHSPHRRVVDIDPSILIHETKAMFRRPIDPIIFILRQRRNVRIHDLH